MQFMKWQSLLCRDKIFESSVQVNDENERSDFERDYNKVIFSPAFRSLQNKTQLFSIPHSDFIHSRLTHSLEVASVGKSLGELVGRRIINGGLASEIDNEFMQDIADIISTACLLHDVGNPPFGHPGEDAISSFFAENSQALAEILPQSVIIQLAHFDGNAQTLRIIHNSQSLNLTLATVASIVKYPTIYDETSIYQHKHGVFDSELSLLNKAFTACKINKLPGSKIYARHPLVFLVEAADDICYQILDLEDAHKLGLISYTDAEKLLLRIVEIKRYDQLAFIRDFLSNQTAEDKFARLRSYVLNILIGEAVDKFIMHYPEIMSGEYNKLIINGKLHGLIDLLLAEQTELSQALQAINDYIQKHAYTYKPLVEIELAGYEILEYLLGQFVFAVINPSSKRNSKLIQILPKRIRLDSLDNAGKVMCIVDYLSGMTDKFALDLYRKLKGIDLLSV
jgi:dGTPase